MDAMTSAAISTARARPPAHAPIPSGRISDLKGARNVSPLPLLRICPLARVLFPEDGDIEPLRCRRPPILAGNRQDRCKLYAIRCTRIFVPESGIYSSDKAVESFGDKEGELAR